MVCKKAPGIIWRAFGAAGIPAIKEPSGLDRQDGKRPDGLTLISWRGGRSLIWDVTVVSPLGASYTLTKQPPTPVQWPTWRRREKLRNIYHFLPHICSSSLPWKILARSARQR